MKVRHDRALFQGLLQDMGHSKQVKSHFAKHADSSEDDEDLADIHAFFYDPPPPRQKKKKRFAGSNSGCVFG